MIIARLQILMNLKDRQMTTSLGETIKRLRTERGLSQQQFADMLYIDRSTCANWETGRRMPDAAMIVQIADVLGVETAYLINVTKQANDVSNVIMLDDERIVLTGGMPVLKKILPDAVVTGFTKPSEALEFARNNAVFIAFVDIEMGKTSGLEVCRQLLLINPRTNVMFLTAYADYSLDAWDTGACGFLLKPISEDAVKQQLGRLRYHY